MMQIANTVQQEIDHLRILIFKTLRDERAARRSTRCTYMKEKKQITEIAKSAERGTTREILELWLMYVYVREPKSER